MRAVRGCATVETDGRGFVVTHSRKRFSVFCVFGPSGRKTADTDIASLFAG